MKTTLSELLTKVFLFWRGTAAVITSAKDAGPGRFAFFFVAEGCGRNAGPRVVVNAFTAKDSQIATKITTARGRHVLTNVAA